MSTKEPAKQKMATSRDVYNRIIWDERLNPNVFTIGFVDRFSSEGIREKPLTAWQTIEKDVPWHRIRYIRCLEVVVWDRDQQLDLFATEHLPDFAWKKEADNSLENSHQAPKFTTRAIYQNVNQNWRPHNQSLISTKLTTLTVVTFNVLSDQYEIEGIETTQRLSTVVEHLRHTHGDIIALQEATPALLQILLAQDWISDYYLSETPEALTLKPYGILILSKLPFTLVEHQFSKHKRILVGTWVINQQTLQIAVVHLPSNGANNAKELRAKQLNDLLAYLNKTTVNCLIVGDFNMKAAEEYQTITQANFIDIWQQLHPHEPGYTFDPQKNPIAAINSISLESSRYDRILLRSNDLSCYFSAIDLFATQPNLEQTSLYPSDHFGLRGILKFSQPLTQTKSLTVIKANPVYQSAVVIIPPIQVSAPIQKIRQSYDKHFERWMPHINLIYGFVSEQYFASAAEAIAQVLAEMEPFTITLSDFEYFTHKNSCTAWLSPITEAPQALKQLQKRLEQLFPLCKEQSQKSPTGFTPHLSVGQFSTTTEGATKLPPWNPVSFSVDSVALISRRANDPFQVRYQVYLGQNEIKQLKDSETQQLSPTEESLRWFVDKFYPDLTPKQQESRETVKALMTQACSECLGFEASLHLLGSARLGTQTDDSDLDMICLIPDYWEGLKFLKSVEESLQGFNFPMQVVEARVPTLRMEIEDISVDLLYARCPATLGLQLPTPSAQPYFDEISWKGILGCLEADLLVDTVSKHLPIESFRELLRVIQAIAKVRSLKGNVWGMLGGFSWVLLAAWSCINYKNSASVEELLLHFFRSLEQHDWSQPITLTEVGKNYEVDPRRDWLPIVTSIAPTQNSARNVTRSTAQILRQEFARAASISAKVLEGKSHWRSLFEPIDLSLESEFFLVLSVATQNIHQEKTYGGWLKSNILALIIDLEKQLNITVRPWTKLIKKDNHISLVLGLEISRNNIPSVEEIAKIFAQGFQEKAIITIAIYPREEIAAFT